ncbi:MAG: hypothetical protein ACH350_05245 [Parachlamydiaceae bacterium]
MKNSRSFPCQCPCPINVVLKHLHIRLVRKLALLEKIALFEQIVLKMLRAYASIRSKNFTKKRPKMAVLASQ